jgi:hypothetical protein
MIYLVESVKYAITGILMGFIIWHGAEEVERVIGE